MSAEFVATLVLLAIGLVLLIALRPSLAETRGGKLLVFGVLFIIPIASLRAEAWYGEVVHDYLQT